MRRRLITFFIGAMVVYGQQYPDIKLTPGISDPSVNQSNIDETICKSGYTKSVRDVPTSLKKQVAARYGMSYPLLPKGGWEIDHFIPLELGGANDILNLWPQPANPKPGFHEKDEVETYLKREVCAGHISLKVAQSEIFHWVDVYKEIKHEK
jgi:hypothetical protein